MTQAVEALVRKTAGLSDRQLAEPWAWRSYDEEGLRFALLMTHHELRDLAVRLAAKRPGRTQAQAIFAQYHEAYRDLSGVLAAVADPDMDRAPAPEEWPVREVLKHMLGAEYGFLRVCGFALGRHRAGNGAEPTDAEWEEGGKAILPQRNAAQEALATATIAQARDLFAEIHIRVLRELGTITDVEVEASSWFWDGEMPLRFRLHRFEEHLRQHTVQLDKTLVAIGRGPTEAHRLVRNVYNALAAVESEPRGNDELRAQFAQVISERAEGIPA